MIEESGGELRDSENGGNTVKLGINGWIRLSEVAGEAGSAK